MGDDAQPRWLWMESCDLLIIYLFEFLFYYLIEVVRAVIHVEKNVDIVDHDHLVLIGNFIVRIEIEVLFRSSASSK